MSLNTPEYNKSYYRKNKEERKEQILLRQHKIRETIQNLKLKSGCSICGYKKSAQALQYHHTGYDKEYNISKMAAQGRALAAIMKEIKKCVVLCANCHAEEHEKKMALSANG